MPTLVTGGGEGGLPARARATPPARAKAGTRRTQAANPPALLTASSAMAQITVAIVTIITLAEPNHGLVELVVLP